MGGGSFETQGGGPAKGLASSFVNHLQKGTKSAGYQQALDRTLSGQALNTNLGRGFEDAIKNMYGIINNSGPAVDYNSPMANALKQILQQQDTQNVNNLRARFTQQGGMGAGTPAAVAEARYMSESNPRTVAALGNLSLQENQLRQQQMGTNLGSLAQMLGNYTSRINQGNQLGAGMIGNYMNASTQLSQLGIPQAQTVRNPGFMEQLGGFIQGAGSLANAIPGVGNVVGGLSNMIGGGLQAPQLMMQYGPNPGAAPLQTRGGYMPLPPGY
jgi:hypothetical protein